MLKKEEHSLCVLMPRLHSYDLNHKFTSVLYFEVGDTKEFYFNAFINDKNN